MGCQALLVPGKCSEQENKIPVPIGHPLSCKLTHKLKKISQGWELKKRPSAAEWLISGGTIFYFRKSNLGRHHRRGDIYIRALMIRSQQNREFSKGGWNAHAGVLEEED